jgi:2-polyprenyl-6-methoxyphenol hydroxylase-like FAD-dependent oxidoreductase
MPLTFFPLRASDSAPAGLLDTYHDERHLAGERTLLHTRAQVALRRGHDPAAQALRELFQNCSPTNSRCAASEP